MQVSVSPSQDTRGHTNPDGSVVHVPDDLVVGAGTYIHPSVVIGTGVTLGAASSIGTPTPTNVNANVTIGDTTQIGDNSTISDGVTLCGHNVIGSNVTIGLECWLGSDTSVEDTATLHESVFVLENCEIGAESVIFAGSVLQPHSILGDKCIVSYAAILPTGWQIPTSRIVNPNPQQVDFGLTSISHSALSSEECSDLLERLATEPLAPYVFRR